MTLPGLTNHRTTLGPHFSEGARLAWVAMESRGETMGAMKRNLDAAQGMVPKWLYGDVKPSRTYSGRLQELYGVPTASWDEKPKKVFLPPAARTKGTGTEG